LFSFLKRRTGNSSSLFSFQGAISIAAAQAATFIIYHIQPPDASPNFRLPFLFVRTETGSLRQARITIYHIRPLPRKRKKLGRGPDAPAFV